VIVSLINNFTRFNPWFHLQLLGIFKLKKTFSESLNKILKLNIKYHFLHTDLKTNGSSKSCLKKVLKTQNVVINNMNQTSISNKKI
jgi:hypothetical protein